MKKILVTGSIAYDHLMAYDGLFKDSILPEEIANLSISFLAEEHNVFFGGCATNIAYSLKVLGEDPVILGVAGNDFERYRNWLVEHGVDVGNIHIDESSPTAVATILSDKNQSQIAVFSPAAMKTFKDDLVLKEFGFSDFAFAVIGPEMPARMKYYAKYFRENGLRYLFDPGQLLHALSKEDLISFVGGSFGMIFNEYEAELWSKKTDIALEDLAKDIFVVKTLGENGCELYFKDGKTHVAAISGVKVSNATGCGDAFRSGFLHGYMKEKSLEDCCKIGNTMASFVLENVGTQDYKFDESEFQNRLSTLN